MPSTEHSFYLYVPDGKERPRCKPFLLLTLENPNFPLPRLIFHQISIISNGPTRLLLFTGAQYSCQIPELLKGNPLLP